MALNMGMGPAVLDHDHNLEAVGVETQVNDKGDVSTLTVMQCAGEAVGDIKTGEHISCGYSELR